MELFDPSEPLHDAPLFRELQRVMASSSGPVNWELARQVGVATAAEAGEDPEPNVQDVAELEEAVRVAELHVARTTDLEPPAELTRVRALRRAVWVGATIEDLHALLEPAAAAQTRALERAIAEQLGQEAPGLAPILRQLGPLLQGTQVGTVLGALARTVLSGADLPFPHPGQAATFVVPNLAAFERAWALERREFRTWAALRELALRFAFAHPWAGERFRELVVEYGSALRIDVAALGERLAELDPADPEALRRFLEHEAQPAFVELDDEQRITLGRIQALVAMADAWADHVAERIAAELLPGAPRIREALVRARDARSGELPLRHLFGVDLPSELPRRAAAFCEAVASATDEPTLARIWSSPEALPSLPEIDEPTLWLSRSV
ncbi:MAG: hydrolase [Actinomycetota bacterium]|nr:MAG: hydrolase [Actinomycetota bacterium]